MKIFFDTEFTGLHKDTTLISLGMVDEEGRTFYAEFTDYDESQCDDWIKENVINNLEYKGITNSFELYRYDPSKNFYYVIGNTKFIKGKLIQWLSEYDYIELVSDVCHYDMVLFINIFGTAFDLPDNVSPVCYDINQDIAKYFNISQADAFDYKREDIINYKIIEGNKHNSLYDAKVIKSIYEYLQWKMKNI